MVASSRSYSAAKTKSLDLNLPLTALRDIATCGNYVLMSWFAYCLWLSSQGWASEKTLDLLTYSWLGGSTLQTKNSRLARRTICTSRTSSWQLKGLFKIWTRSWGHVSGLLEATAWLVTKSRSTVSIRTLKKPKSAFTCLLSVTLFFLRSISRKKRNQAGDEQALILMVSPAKFYSKRSD